MNKIFFKRGCLLLIVLVLFSFVSSPGYSSDTKVKGSCTQEQVNLRSLQTRNYPGIPSHALLKASLNVMQDKFYFIEQIDGKSGFFVASREFDTRDKYIKLKDEFGSGKLMSGIKRFSISRTEVDVNVTPLSEKDSTIRVSFRKKILNMYDVAIRVRDVTNQELYDEFYSSLDDEIKRRTRL